ncbi:MAG: hypothetical protein EBS84_13500 [Proteobacteria bacterium]|nr:hypothetical protein [Pseudomonadota bacterium]
MTTYVGRREGHAVIVSAGDQPLNPRLDLWRHSPTGFEWGYGGSGPAQLALALLADHLADDERALALYQRFKWTVVSHFPYAGWTLTGRQIEHALASLSAQSKGVPAWTCIVPPVASRGMFIISGTTPSSRRA